MDKFITISQLSKQLNLINDENNKPLNYILRYWEKEFKEIKPTIINKQRYYTHRQINKIKMIKFLLKDKGMTIKGAKNMLNSNINKLDDHNSDSLKADYYKKKINERSKKILDKINKIKNYGKKNSH